MTDEKLIEYKGEKHTLMEWSRIKGVHPRTLRHRLYTLGWSFKEAIEKPSARRKQVLIEYNGEKHPLIEWSKIKGIHISTLENRLYKYGWSVERTMETPAKTRSNNYKYIEYEYNGKKHTLIEWSKIKGIRYRILRDRLYKYGWSFKEAIETPVRNNEDVEIFECNGESHSIYQWSCIRNIPCPTLYSRIYDLKWPIEEALGFKEHTNNGKRINKSVKLFEYNGESYNISEWATIRNIPWTTLYYRIHKLKWPIEEALGFKEHINKKATKGDNNMLSTDTTKVTIHEDRSCTIPTVWTEAEDEIIKKSIRESISTHNTYLMLNRKHSADSIELRKAIIMRTMGIEYNYNNDEKKTYTMKDIAKCVYPNITLDKLDLVRATGRIREVLIALNLFDEGYCKKGNSTRYYNFTETDINKICNTIHNKFPGGIKSTSIYMCANKEQTQVNKEDCEIDSVSNVCEDIKTDTMQQLPLIQQQYRVQINQFNEFINKLQQDNNTKFKQTKIHFDNNSVRFMVEWE